MTDPTAHQDERDSPQSTEDSASVDADWSPWPPIGPATLAHIHDMISDWPEPTASQLEAVRALRPSLRRASSPPGSTDEPAKRCA